MPGARGGFLHESIYKLLDTFIVRCGLSLEDTIPSQPVAVMQCHLLCCLDLCPLWGPDI